jgi:hypothetical protein
MKAQNAVISIHLLREEFDMWKQNPNAISFCRKHMHWKKGFRIKKKNSSTHAHFSFSPYW